MILPAPPVVAGADIVFPFLCVHHGVRLADQVVRRPAAAFLSYFVSSSLDSDGVTIVTMSHDERMSVVISVDESDILALQDGQAAEISIESIGDQKYQGTVTEVDKTANSSSGVTAYSAEISFDKGPNMLSGMTAEVVIRIEGTENVLIVPTDSVHRTSAISYVYTTYDAQNATYGGMKTVETGISNDDFTAIRSGLEAGDVVYYTEKDDSFFFGFPGAGGSYNGNYGSPGTYRNRR